MRKQVAIAALLLLTLSLGACAGSSGNTSSADEASTNEQTEQAAEPANQEGQVFENDAAKVTYRDKMEPTQGNAMYNFELENKTAGTVMVSGENVVVNDEASVETLGGSATPIQPGTTGSVSLVFGYTVQTSLQAMDEIHQLSGELVMRDNDTLDEVGRVAFSIEV